LRALRLRTERFCAGAPGDSAIQQLLHPVFG
jgi:hypothetical protein